DVYFHALLRNKSSGEIGFESGNLINPCQSWGADDQDSTSACCQRNGMVEWYVDAGSTACFVPADLRPGQAEHLIAAYKSKQTHRLGPHKQLEFYIPGGPHCDKSARQRHNRYWIVAFQASIPVTDGQSAGLLAERPPWQVCLLGGGI